MKCCISAVNSYLSHSLNPDNLCPFCRNLSEVDLHGLRLRFYVAILVGSALRYMFDGYSANGESGNWRDG